LQERAAHLALAQQQAQQPLQQLELAAGGQQRVCRGAAAQVLLGRKVGQQVRVVDHLGGRAGRQQASERARG
jgi:hypothetical protein